MGSVTEAATGANKLEDHPPRIERVSSAINQAILSPGSVSINVQGAFIAEDASPVSPTPSDDAAQHDTDIRLPNHQAVVSHVALDASLPPKNLSHRNVSLIRNFP